MIDWPNGKLYKSTEGSGDGGGCGSIGWQEGGGKVSRAKGSGKWATKAIGQPVIDKRAGLRYLVSYSWYRVKGRRLAARKFHGGGKLDHRGRARAGGQTINWLFDHASNGYIQRKQTKRYTEQSCAGIRGKLITRSGWQGDRTDALRCWRQILLSPTSGRVVGCLNR